MVKYKTKLVKLYKQMLILRGNMYRLKLSYTISNKMQ